MTPAVTFRTITEDAAINIWMSDHRGVDEYVVTCVHGATICTCVRCGQPSQLIAAANCEHVAAALAALTGRVVVAVGDQGDYVLAEAAR